MKTQVPPSPSQSVPQREPDREQLLLLAMDRKSTLSLFERWGLILWLGGVERTGLW